MHSHPGPTPTPAEATARRSTTLVFRLPPACAAGPTHLCWAWLEAQIFCQDTRTQQHILGILAELPPADDQHRELYFMHSPNRSDESPLDLSKRGRNLARGVHFTGPCQQTGYLRPEALLRSRA